MPDTDSLAGIVHYRNARLHYTRTGSGSQVLLAFHGFGQNRAHLRPLAAQLSGRFTIYSFDLFYHGQSFWGDRENPLTKQAWTEMLSRFLSEQKIERFALAGYSLGGKFVLATLESFPDRTTEIILVAPDGIKTNFWYSLATYPVWAQRLFRSTVTKPQRFQSIALWMRRLRIVDKGILRFAQSQMDTREKRHRVYFAWMVFRELAFDMNHIAALINGNRIPVVVFLGRYDKIITAPNMRRLLDKVPGAQLIVLEAGHSRLIESVAEYYAKQEKRPPPCLPTGRQPPSERGG